MDSITPGSDAEHLEHLRRELARQQESQQVAMAVPDAVVPGRAVPGQGRRKAGVWGTLGAAGALVLSKLKFLLVGLKFLKLGKVLTTGLSMVVTIWVYTAFFGFKFALGFVLLIFIHEMGHAAVISMKGLRAGAPVFIPFFGAAIVLKDQPTDVRAEAEIAIAGPIAGGLASAACWAYGALAGSQLFLALAYTGFFLNLFNLLPVSPLDGGRVVAAISRWIWIAGLAIALPLAFYWGHPILIAVVVLGGMRAWQTWKVTPEQADYYHVEPTERILIAVAYFGLAIGLALGAAHLHSVIRTVG